MPWQVTRTRPTALPNDCSPSTSGAGQTVTVSVSLVASADSRARLTWSAHTPSPAARSSGGDLHQHAVVGRGPDLVPVEGAEVDRGAAVEGVGDGGQLVGALVDDVRGLRHGAARAGRARGLLDRGRLPRDGHRRRRRVGRGAAGRAGVGEGARARGQRDLEAGGRRLVDRGDRARAGARQLGGQLDGEGLLVRVRDAERAPDLEAGPGRRPERGHAHGVVDRRGAAADGRGGAVAVDRVEDLPGVVDVVRRRDRVGDREGVALGGRARRSSTPGRPRRARAAAPRGVRCARRSSSRREFPQLSPVEHPGRTRGAVLPTSRPSKCNLGAPTRHFRPTRANRRATYRAP